MSAPEKVQASGTNPADAYESFMVPAIFRPWAAELLRRVDVQPGERVLDVACGTGAVSRQVAPTVGATGSVTALDFSPHMLKVARSLPVPDGAEITWVEGSAESLPFADGDFDLVMCQQGLQFVPDRQAATNEMHRVLRRGGRAGISVWRGLEHQTVYQAFNETVDRHLGVVTESGPFSLGNPDELRDLLATAGFQQVALEEVTRTVRFQQPDRFVRLSVLAIAAVVPQFADLDNESRDALVVKVSLDIEDTLRSYREGDMLAFPMVAHIATAVA